MSEPNESTIHETLPADSEAVVDKVGDSVGAVGDKAGAAAHEALDLLDVAGGAMAKRLIPIAVVAVLVIVVIVLLLV